MTFLDVLETKETKFNEIREPLPDPKKEQQVLQDFSSMNLLVDRDVRLSLVVYMSFHCKICFLFKFSSRM